MATVGSMLSAERVRQGLDVQDIARITKLTPRTVQAIEADDFEQLPGLIFARNFVRQYAEALHLETAAISRQFEREQSLPAPEFVVTEDFSPIFVSKVNVSGLSGFFASDAVSAFATFVFTLAACAVAFWGFQYWRAHKAVSEPPKQARTEAAPPKAKMEPASPAVAAPAVAPRADATAGPSPTTAGETAPQEIASAAPPVAPVALGAVPPNAGAPSAVHVELTATAACWTRITADGKTLFAGTLQPGDTRTIDAASVITIRAGNAAALGLKLNGNDVPALGPAGQIRSVTMTQAGAQVRAPSPELLSDF